MGKANLWCKRNSRLYKSHFTFPNPKILLLLLAGIILGLTGLLPAQAEPRSSQWEPAIRAFEKRDQTNPPPQDAVLFIGSSAIRKWTTLAKDFPGIAVINRGFGGSQIEDSTFYANRIIFPYHPRIIVFFAGNNDLASGKSPDDVVAEFTNFVGVVRAQLPLTRIVYISISATTARWKLKDKIIETNHRIAATQGDNLVFVDVFSHMLGPDGKPRKDLLLSDGLHPNETCYLMWASLIRPDLN